MYFTDEDLTLIKNRQQDTGYAEVIDAEMDEYGQNWHSDGPILTAQIKISELSSQGRNELWWHMRPIIEPDDILIIGWDIERGVGMTLIHNGREVAHHGPADDAFGLDDMY